MRFHVPLNEINIKQDIDCMLAEIETVKDRSFAVQMLQTIYEEERSAFVDWLCDTVQDLKDLGDDKRFSVELEALREAVR